MACTPPIIAGNATAPFPTLGAIFDVFPRILLRKDPLLAVAPTSPKAAAPTSPKAAAPVSPKAVVPLPAADKVLASVSVVLVDLAKLPTPLRNLPNTAPCTNPPKTLPPISPIVLSPIGAALYIEVGIEVALMAALPA